MAGDYQNEDVLRKRFEEFSTSESFVLIKIKDRNSGEKSSVVCTNTDWYMTLYNEKEYSFPSQKDYVDFMVKNYDKEFVLSHEAYKELIKISAAETDFEGLRGKGVDYIVKTYLKKYYWSPGGSYDYIFKDEKMSRNRSFLKILLELGLIVRSDCESGMIYVESENIKI
ncbi:MAG: hypothetical protein ABRQ39_10765 [Candidatus Eremiobacterota bacterium]